MKKWIEAKAAEKLLTEIRREIEDSIIENHPEETGFKVTITERINRKVNSDLLQEIAAENGLTDHLSSLFRWKAEINSKDWRRPQMKV